MKFDGEPTPYELEKWWKEEMEEITAIRAELEKAKVEARELRSALSSLIGEQNGPPLIRNARYWYEAMIFAYKTLGDERCADYYRNQLLGMTNGKVE